MTAAVRARRDLLAAQQALAALDRHLTTSTLSPNTIRAYRRQCRAYVAWIAGRSGSHPKAFTDPAGAQTAVAAWRRHLLLTVRARPAGVNQGLAAVTLLYAQGPGFPLRVRRARVPPPPKPPALTPAEVAAVERAALRRGERDAAIVALLRYAGARVEECARLDAGDVATAARDGRVVLRGPDGGSRTVLLPAVARARIGAWLSRRGNAPGPLFVGQRGPLSVSGITQVVLAVGEAAGLPGLRPLRLRR